jgi:hypothetical protein
VTDETMTEARYHLLKLDETAYWAEEIADKVGRIFGTYIYDVNRRVHCCEFTPSYELIFVGSQWHSPELSERESDDLDKEIRVADAQTETIRYAHCHQVDALPRIREGNLAVGVIDLEIDDDDEAREYLAQREV